MTLHHTVARIGLFAATFAVLGMAGAQAQGASPITVVKCSIRSAGGGPGSPMTQSLWIDYRNAAKVTATTVTFHVALPSGMAGNVTDSGKFAPGAEINHQLFSSAVVVGTTATKPSVCEAVAATFADGTKWTKS